MLFESSSDVIGQDNQGTCLGTISVQNQGNFSLQQKPSRNCHVCGDHANGFNLNVPRYFSCFIVVTFAHEFLTLNNLRYSDRSLNIRKNIKKYLSCNACRLFFRRAVLNEANYECMLKNSCLKRTQLADIKKCKERFSISLWNRSIRFG